MISRHDILNAQLSDYVFVRVKSVLVESVGFITDENGKLIELQLAQNFNPEKEETIKGDKFNISAEVIAAPVRLTNNDSYQYSEYLGCPKPLRYPTHDEIVKKVNALPDYVRKRLTGLTKANKIDSGDAVTLDGVQPEVKVGDKVYFHFNCLRNKENYAWREENGDLVYKIHYESLFCTVRNQQIIMLNSYVLVSELLENKEKFDGVEGRKVGDLLVVENKEEVKGNKKAKYLTGILEAIGKSVKDDVNARSVKVGSKVIFRPNSQFKNEIEGKEYLVMRQWDLVAEFMVIPIVDEPDAVYPIGDYVMLTPDEQVISKTKLHVFDQNNPDQQAKPGELFVLPNSINPYKKLKKYGTGVAMHQGERVKGDWVMKKVMYEKSGYYMYLGEYGVTLVREADLYGELTEN